MRFRSWIWRKLQCFSALCVFSADACVQSARIDKQAVENDKSLISVARIIHMKGCCMIYDASKLKKGKIDD